MIHEEICTYELCKLAKEKGFNNKCYHYYQNGALESDECFNRYNKGVESVCSAPTQSLLQRWLREEKGVNMQVIWMEPYNRYYWSLWINDEFMVSEYIDPEQAYSNYELALEDALKYALENLV